jgi:hypothetical protein
MAARAGIVVTEAMNAVEPQQPSKVREGGVDRSTQACGQRSLYPARESDLAQLLGQQMVECVLRWIVVPRCFRPSRCRPPPRRSRTERRRPTPPTPETPVFEHASCEKRDGSSRCSSENENENRARSAPGWAGRRPQAAPPISPLPPNARADRSKHQAMKNPETASGDATRHRAWWRRSGTGPPRNTGVPRRGHPVVHPLYEMYVLYTDAGLTTVRASHVWVWQDFAALLSALLNRRLESFDAKETAVGQPTAPRRRP